MTMKYIRYGLMVILILSAFVILVSCGPSGGGDDSEITVAEEDVVEEEVGPAAAFISLATSQTTVQSDNSDFATITATVLDAGRAVLEGATVSFSADGGQISASSESTDGNGQALISFSSGAASGGVSQVVTITAEVGGLNPATIPIQVVGTSVVLTTNNTNITEGDTVDLTVHVEDFSSGGLENVLVTLSESSTTISLSQTIGYTDGNGELVVQVTADAPGSGTVTAEAMGITATLTFTVGTTGTVFGIIDPTTDPYYLDTNTPLTITVDAAGLTPFVDTVVFATTIGTWSGGGSVEYVVVDGAGEASSNLTSTEAGMATVQVFNEADPSTKDSMTVAISAPPSEASQISLQPSASSVAPSFGDVSNSITLEATVKNASDQVVGNALVAFSILNPIGGGESISPVVVFTGTDGVAASTFTSGTLTSGADGVTIEAVVVGTLISDSVSIVIGGTPGSVIIGRSTKVSIIAGDTAYSLPMSVLVADPGGNPVSGVTVSLNVWPAYYNTGYNPDDGEPVITGTYFNEDINENLILDVGEDLNGDLSLTPPNAAAGTLPASVTTDENGVASFDLVYLKQSAVWIADVITATTVVSGTETSSTLVFTLPYAESDEKYLPDSPYGYGDLSITVSAGANGTITPAGPIVIVPYGADQTFDITPAGGYEVGDVLVDGVSVGALTSYTFIYVEENHTISATFVVP